MKKLLALALVVMVAGGALATEDNMMGMFFVDGGPYDQSTNNYVNTFTPFNGYVVLLNPTVESIGGYELGIGIPATVFLLAVSGPNGWTNFGSNINHLAGYQTPVPVAEPGTVLATINMLYTGTDVIFVEFGPSDPSSVPEDLPAIADGTNPDLLIACNLVGDAGGPAPNVVATINGNGVVATENHTLTGVKALFD